MGSSQDSGIGMTRGTSEGPLQRIVELCAPVFQFQSLDASKLADVVGYEREVSGQSLTCQKGVVGADRLALLFQGSPDQPGSRGIFDREVVLA